jgi:hypothetical protein
MLGENIEIPVANENIANDQNKIGRRPYLSLKGPKNNCPKAKPNILVVKPICTIDVVELKTLANDGNVGRYISVTNGPKADKIPRNIIRNTKYLRDTPKLPSINYTIL